MARGGESRVPSSPTLRFLGAFHSRPLAGAVTVPASRGSSAAQSLESSGEDARVKLTHS